MPWVKIDDGFWSNPKVAMAPPEAVGLFVKALSWSGQHLTDGRIPRENLTLLLPNLTRSRREKVARMVSDAGLWVDESSEFVIPDFLEFNQSKAEISKKREQARERMRTSRGRGSQDVRANKTRSSRTPTRPDPNPIEQLPPKPPGGGSLDWVEKHAPKTLAVYRADSPRRGTPTIAWQSAIQEAVESRGDGYAADHLGRFFSANGKDPVSFLRRCAEDWGAGASAVNDASDFDPTAGLTMMNSPGDA